MKSAIFVLCYLQLYMGCSAAPQEAYNDTLEEFEEKYHAIIDSKDPDFVNKTRAQLKQEEEEINAQNLDYDNGNASFSEQLNAFSMEDDATFEKEHEGAIPPNGDTANTRSLGLIHASEEDVEWFMNDPENRAALEKMNRELAANRNSVPASYNAVKKGLITGVKNQGGCGSCVAFASASMMETCLIKAGAKKASLDLAEQYLVDCGYGYEGRQGWTIFSAKGCNGAGVGAYAFFVKGKGGKVPYELKYPYKSGSSEKHYKCDTSKKAFNPGAKVATPIIDFKCTEDKLKGLVAKYGAVVTTVYAADHAFRNYKSGVFNGCSTNAQTNHAVVVVGYGKDAKGDYWLVKNSWGTWWGDKGYIKIKRGAKHCGIAGICMVAKCAATGSSDVVPVTKPPPASSTCDISTFFGTITGTIRVTLGTPAGTFQNKLKCKKGVCSVVGAKANQNACKLICGNVTCKR